MDYELFSAQRRHDFRHRLDLLAAVRVAPAEQQRVIDLSFRGIDKRLRDAVRRCRRITMLQAPETVLDLDRAFRDTL